MALALADVVAAERRKRPLVLTAAFPFVPAELTLANLASTYLPADVCRRILTMLGRRCALVCGTDVHSIQVSCDGQTRLGAEEACDRSHAAYLDFFDRYGIEFDAYLKTDDPDHRTLTRVAWSRLSEAGLLAELPVEVLVCDDCGAAPPPRLASADDEPGRLRCPWCGGAALRRESRSHLHIVLERARGIIEGAPRTLAGGNRKWIDALLTRPLDPWCATRDNRVGLSFPELGEGRSLYLWFDSLIGYGTLRARLAARDPVFADAELLHFFGKNIVFHHAILWPLILRLGLDGDPSRIRSSVRGFLLAEPPSLDTWSIAPDLAADYARLYGVHAAFDWPRDFTLESALAETFVDRIVIGKVAVHCRRLALACAAGDTRTAEPGRLGELAHLVAPGAAELAAAASGGSARHSLLLTLDMVKALGRHFGSRTDLSSSAEVRGEAAVGLAYLLTLMAPFAPRIVDEFNIFDGWFPGSIMNCESTVQHPLRDRSLTWPRIGVGATSDNSMPEAVMS